MLQGDPALPSQRGIAPNFWPIPVVAKRSPISAIPKLLCCVVLVLWVLTFWYFEPTIFMLLWPPCGIEHAFIFSFCNFVFYLFSTHGAAFVQIGTAGLECTARGSLQMQDIKRHHKFSAQSLNFVGLCRRTWVTCRRTRKIDLLPPLHVPTVWWTLAYYFIWDMLLNFNEFRVWRQPNFAALHKRHCLYSVGRPSSWALAHIFVNSISYLHSLDVADDVTSR